jgi:trehalose 2-sulfotransferase
VRYTEQQLNSELLDQPEFVGESTKLFICSTPRSGSYMLCRYMINAGLGVPHEYFNPIIMREMAPRLGLGAEVASLKWRHRSPLDRLPFGKAARTAEMAFLEKYCAVLAPRRCQRGIFAAKIHYDQYVKVLDNPVGHAVLEGGLFIHLYREDLLAQAVSTHFANLTGRWSIDDAVTTVPASDRDFFDVAAIDRAVEELAEQDRGWRLFLARNGLPAISISYERLCEDPAGFVAQVARRAGLDPGVLPRDYSEASSPTGDDPSLPRKSEVIRRYLAATRTLADVAPVPARVTQDRTRAGTGAGAR